METESKWKESQVIVEWKVCKVCMLFCFSKSFFFFRVMKKNRTLLQMLCNIVVYLESIFIYFGEKKQRISLSVFFLILVFF